MKSYSDGELIRQAFVTFSENRCSALDITNIKKLQLSNGTVTWQVECMSGDLCDQLFSKSTNFIGYSVALRYIKDVTDRAISNPYQRSHAWLQHLWRISHVTFWMQLSKGVDTFCEFRASLEETHLESFLQLLQMVHLWCLDRSKAFRDILSNGELRTTSLLWYGTTALFARKTTLTSRWKWPAWQSL